MAQHPPANPFPIGYVPPGGRRYEVSSGESLASIARDNGISEDELDLFNFNATHPDEINWCLEHRVHCKHKTHNRANWMFTTENPRLYIYLPPLPPGAKPPARPAPAPGLGPAAKPALPPIAATVALPDTEFKVDIPVPRTGPYGLGSASPVLVWVSGKFTVKGTYRVDGSHSKISFSPDKVDVEARFKEKFGEFKLKASVKPGEVSKLALEWGPDDIPISIEFAANADFVRPFTLAGKWKNAIPLADFPITEHVRFNGVIEPQLVFDFSANPKWAGWRYTARAVAQGTRVAVRSGVNAVRGIFIAEEAGTLTAVGAATVAAVVAAAVIGFVLFGLYEVDQAHIGGRALGVKLGFAGGYASGLTSYTNDYWTPRGDREFQDLQEDDWEAALSVISQVFVHGDSNVFIGYEQLARLGKAAVAQMVADFIQKNGLPAWDAIRKKHQQRYGTSVPQRREAYFDILRLQIQSGRDPIGIDILK